MTDRLLNVLAALAAGVASFIVFTSAFLWYHLTHVVSR